MRFLLTDEYWVLDALSPAEWHLVAELPDIAAGEAMSPASKERLFPSPLSPDTIADEGTLEQESDWRDFVHPDFDDLFSSARDRVNGDLETAHTVDPEEFIPSEELESIRDTLPTFRRLNVPIAHTEAWYSTLNQARLLLNEEHDLAESEDRTLAQLKTDESVDQDRLLLIAKYELYSMLQVWLIERVMESEQ